jgi:hypothetical protein
MRSYDYYTSKLANTVTARQRAHNYGVLVNAIHDYFRNRTTLDVVSRLIELGKQLDFIAECREIPDFVPAVVERPLVRNPNRHSANQPTFTDDSANLIQRFVGIAASTRFEANNV